MKILINFLLSLTTTLLLIWGLGRPIHLGEPAHAAVDEKGDSIWVASTERFIPPIGKLFSPSQGFWQNAEGATPDLVTSLDHPYLSAPVTVYYDDRLVPHIFAENEQDVLFAQGYVTASLRLWQMELQTHSAAGRLAEVLGTTERLRNILIGRDRTMRRLGLAWSARRSVEYWAKTPQKYKAIKDYTEGINAYINSLSYHELPLFYKLQDYEPEEWTPLKTAILLKYMGHMLTNRDQDFQQTAVLKEVGLEGFERLYGEYFEEQSPIILDTMTYTEPPVAVADTVPLQFYLGTLGWDSLTHAAVPKGIGSNNWAVSGEKTISGHPILCNDPHLKLNLPSIWFEVQLHTPEFNVYGVTLPGAPAVISGFNEHIAWGITNVSHDVKDWYAIQWKDEKKDAYWFDSTYRSAEFFVETIQVRDAEPVYDTIRVTHMGPISYSHEGQDFALRWTLHDPAEEPLMFLKLLRAKNYSDYKAAIRHFGCPAQNVVFASKDGDIALWTQGKLPIRRPFQGRFVQQGTNSAQLWQGYIPQEHIPHEYNPEKGFVASANQHSINPSVYPYDFYGYFEEYRGRYLNRRLTEMDSITIQDMMALQYDAYSVKAEDFMGILNQHLQKGKLDKNGLEIWHLVKDWDFRYTRDQVGPTIFENWFDTLQVLVYDELLNTETVPGPAQRLRLPDNGQLLTLLKRDTSHPFIDIQATEAQERVGDVVTIAFQRAANSVPRDEVTQKILPWNQRRATKIEHIANVAPLGIDSISSDGDVSALNAIGDDRGPSWRMVVQLGPEMEAYGIYPGGQSGNPGSAYYANSVGRWAEGKYYRLLYMKKPTDFDDRIIFKQTLEP